MKAIDDSKSFGAVRLNRSNVNRDIPTALKRMSITLNIRRYTTDANGTVLDDLMIPDSEKKPYPVHLFGEFDRQGGYAIADLEIGQRYNTLLFGVYVWGVGTPTLFFNPLANINRRFRKGDIVFVYVDDLDTPNYFTFIQVQSTQGGAASILSQSNITQLDSAAPWGVFKINGFKYAWLDDEQLNYALFKIVTKQNAAFVSDSIDPQTYRSAKQKPSVKIIDIPDNIVLNQYEGISTFIPYENSLLTLTFDIYA
jgi:hypothetical protein